MTETTLERAARAMFENDCLSHYPDDPTPVWSEVKGDYLSSARDVLMAVREPGEAALNAECDLGPGHREGQWKAMIDAILAEGGTLATSPGVD